MNVGTEMFLEVYERQKLMVQTEYHLAECSRTLRLQLCHDCPWEHAHEIWSLSL